MSVAVLCIGGSSERWHNLEAGGYEVLRASDEGHAVELLRTQLVNVVCIDSRCMAEAESPAMGASLKSVVPHVPVVLVQTASTMPWHYEQQVAVVIDEAGFDAMGHWLIEELHELRFPLFVQWFEDWKRSRTQRSNEGSVHTC